MAAKVGATWWECFVDDDGSVEMWEWRIRSIRKGRAFATLKCDLTWGKLSRRKGDWGWRSSIPRYCRCSWAPGKTLPFGLRSTKLAAVREAQKNYEPEHFLSEAGEAKARRTLAGLETRFRRKKVTP